jgi:hypothetical protein
LLIIRDPAVAGRYAENWQTHAPRRSVADFRTTPDNARKSLGRPVCHKTLTSQPFLPGPPLAAPEDRANAPAQAKKLTMRTLILPLGVVISPDSPVWLPDVVTAARRHAAELPHPTGKDNQAMNVEALLEELRSSRTDLWRWVKIASESQAPSLAIPAQAIRAWEQREPQTWAKVAAWLAAHGKRVVEI